MKCKITGRYKDFIINNHLIRIYKCRLGKRLAYMTIFIYDEGTIGLGMQCNPRKAINRAKSYVDVISR